tara:strand:- start:94 stop:888 length:795 start_codon:yes stop_codon:yes gene_type:complete
MPISNGQLLFGAPTSVTGWDFSESQADSDTYVVEAESSTANGSETAAGMGLTGTYLSVTATNVAAVDGSGYRQFTNGRLEIYRDNSTNDFYNNWLPRDATRVTWSWAMLIKDVSGLPSTSFFNWVGGTASATADAAIYAQGHSNSTTIRVIHLAGNAYMNTNQTLTFNPGSTDYVWICNWGDGTYNRFGWISSSTSEASPEAYSDFPSTQRFSVSWTAGANSNYWNYNPLYVSANYGIGANNGNAVGNFKFKKFVASKLKIATD